VAAARLAILEVATTAKETARDKDKDKDREESRRYFAKPGSAEWGC